MHLAVPYYEKVLKEDTPVDGRHLKQEAAYNLSLIYKNSGNIELARQTISKFIVF